MLTFEEKLSIIESFKELQRNNVSLGRVNYQLEESLYDKKNVIYHLHPNGNGFVYAGLIKGYKKDEKGLVNIRDFSAEALRSLIQASINSLTTPPKPSIEEAIVGDGEEERWVGPHNQTLLLVHEDELWNVYSGLNLDAAFESYVEAKNYLEEEGYTLQS
ncbi:hypothetical protein ACQCN2_01315 [Brevibacillus ginsengisoli]|uniref:hypothetical protein n=1 Tax=Brevibacillus ginsengisoli TaxID=363854 RepID=UPI003CEE5DBD